MVKPTFALVQVLHKCIYQTLDKLFCIPDRFWYAVAPFYGLPHTRKFKKLIKMSSCAKLEFLNFRWFRIFNLNVGGLSYFEGERPEGDGDGFADDFDLNTAFESYKSVIIISLLKFQFFVL